MLSTTKITFTKHVLDRYFERFGECSEEEAKKVIERIVRRSCGPAPKLQHKLIAAFKKANPDSERNIHREIAAGRWRYDHKESILVIGEFTGIGKFEVVTLVPVSV